MMSEPWADSGLSQDLLQLCAAGESETIEFKRELPSQKRDFAKEIAALASTAGGMILVGVADDGSVVGVGGAEVASVRDGLCARVVGLCQQIEPPVRPKLLWASALGRAVLCIQVEKGETPLYFLDGRAYIRHSTVSRPATPAEIQAAMSRPSPETPKADPALSELAVLLATVLRWCDIDAAMRGLNPWVDSWTYVAEISASRLREIAATEWAVTNAHEPSLEDLADKLDKVAGFLHTFGSGSSFEHICADVRFVADDLMQKLIWPVGIDERSQAGVRSKIITYSRQTSSMWARATKDIFDGRVNKAQEESSAIGEQIATWTYFPLTFLPEDARVKLRKVALNLIGLAAQRTYMDGGESLRRLVHRGQELSEQLGAVTRSFS
jgi:ATP-dependent DNA helicase RecG